MKNNAQYGYKNKKAIVRPLSDTAEQKILQATHNSLIESLLDVPAHRLETYIACTSENYITKISSKILAAKKQTAEFFEKAKI